MIAKGILFFAWLLQIELSLGLYCNKDLPYGTTLTSRPHDSIFCVVAEQTIDDDGPNKSPYIPKSTSETYVNSSGTAGTISPSPSPAA